MTHKQSFPATGYKMLDAFQDTDWRKAEIFEWKKVIIDFYAMWVSSAGFIVIISHAYLSPSLSYLFISDQ